MNDHPINAVREARRKISEQFGHDPRKLVAHYRKLQERHKDRLVSSGSEPCAAENLIDSPEPAATRD